MPNSRGQKRHGFFDASGDGSHRFDAQETSPQVNSDRLRSYLAERFPADTGASAPVIDDANSPFVVNPDQFSSSWLRRGSEAQGNQINSLDTEFTAGLEQYLPTPATRLRIIKERLSREIDALERKIQRYQRLQLNPEYQEKQLLVLRDRYQTLKQHELQVSQDLERLFSDRTVLMRVVSSSAQWMHDLSGRFQTNGPLQNLNPGHWLEKLDPDRGTIKAMNETLQELTEHLTERLSTSQGKNAATAGEELSQVLTQYDQTLRQIERLTRQIQSRPPLFARFNQQVRQWMSPSSDNPQSSAS